MTKIMGVDNQPDVIRLLRTILEKAGYEFVGCLSGEECLEKYVKEKPDLILLDIMMPGLDGWRVYKRLRKLNKDQRVAFLTAVGMSSEIKERVIEKGAADYIIKPFEPSELLERIKTILKK